MRLTGVWMVSLDQDHAFRDQHLLQLGIRSGYLTVVSRVPCARLLRCAGRHERGDSSIIRFLFIQWQLRFLFRVLNRFIQHQMAYLLQNLPPDKLQHGHSFWWPLATSPCIFCIPGLWQDYFRSWPSIMHHMDMNEAYGCLGGIRGPGSCLSRPTSTPAWHQIWLVDCGK